VGELDQLLDQSGSSARTPAAHKAPAAPVAQAAPAVPAPPAPPPASTPAAVASTETAYKGKQTYDFDAEVAAGDLVRPDGENVRLEQLSWKDIVVVPRSSRASLLSEARAVRATRRDEPLRVRVGIAPPAWLPPVYAADLPASLAGGYDLLFPSLRPETVRSGEGARQVALFAESWPVTVERRLFPALAPHAYLTAEIRNSSGRALCGGPAELFVGNDPAGTAKLDMVAPGETFTLPLGIDRAVRPLRNVTLNTSEHGIISREEVNEYVVVDEVANPYRVPLQLRIFDQWPVTTAPKTTSKLERADRARQDWEKGELEWIVTVPPGGTSKVSYTFTLRRPKGWRLHQ
jgi:hypothetical protein